MEHLHIDCATGEEARRPLSDEEVAAKETDEAATQEQRQAREDRLARLRARAKQDTDFADLLEHLGVTV